MSRVSQGALLSSSSPLVLPAVSWPASNEVIGQLQDKLDTAPLYLDAETLGQLRLNASSPALLVFRLPYGLGYERLAACSDATIRLLRVGLESFNREPFRFRRADLMSAKEILSGNGECVLLSV